MADSDKTFGEFFDAVYDTEVMEGRLWMDEWKDLATPEEWEEVRNTPCSAYWMFCFAYDMANSIRRRLQGICTDTLYARTFEAGRSFLQEIKEKAREFKTDVSSATDVPLTASEAIARSQRI